ncbi:MAG TPA: TIGR04076 family protein [Candidatus Omnitrophica bacterium]|nr:TIGR04076 family protein [Candidatus Omnitrophota bacterium]
MVADKLVYKLVGKIISIKGECHAGHKVGEEIDLTLFDGDKVRRRIDLCPFFLDKLFPYLCTLQFGGQFPWQSELELFVDSCPDEENKVTIRIERRAINKGR